MNVYGVILVLIFGGASGVFGILAMMDDVTSMTTSGTVLEGTEWYESEGSREECAEMGYYYDEYGDEYEECDRYRTITYFKCHSDVDFTYALADDQSGFLYDGQDRVTWDESQSSCLSQIQDTYAVNKSVSVYYLSDAPEDGKLSQQFPPGALYVCCSLCFGLLTIPAMILIFTNRSENVNIKTGGFMGKLRPKRIPLSNPTQQTMSNQGQPNYSQANPQIPQSSSTIQTSSGGGPFGAGGMMVVPLAGGAANPTPSNQQPSQVQQSRVRSQSNGTQSSNWRAPSRIAGYQRVLSKMNMGSGQFGSAQEYEQILQNSGMMDRSMASGFMSNPFVLQTLGIAAVAGGATAAMSSASQAQTSLRPAQSGDARLKSMQKEAEDFFKSSKPKVNTATSRPVAKGEPNQCAHNNCTTRVSSFDFRCFDCRRRYCTAHKGTTFQCEECAN